MFILDVSENKEFLTEEDEKITSYASFKNEFNGRLNLVLNIVGDKKYLSLYKLGDNGYKPVNRELWPKEITDFITYECLLQ